MRIMSFGLTQRQLIDGTKTVTRRKWKEAWVKPGDLVQAWSKGPHRGGRKMGVLKIVSITPEIFGDNHITIWEAEREGFQSIKELVAALEKAGARIGDKLFRIRFEPVGQIR